MSGRRGLSAALECGNNKSLVGWQKVLIVRKIWFLLLTGLLLLGSSKVMAQEWINIPLEYPLEFDGTSDNGGIEHGHYDAINSFMYGEKTCFKIDVALGSNSRAVPRELMIAFNQGDDRYGVNIASGMSPGIWTFEFGLSDMLLIDPDFGDLISDKHPDPNMYVDYFIMRSHGGGWAEVRDVSIRKDKNCARTYYAAPPPAENPIPELCSTDAVAIPKVIGNGKFVDFPSSTDITVAPMSIILFVQDDSIFQVQGHWDGHYGNASRFTIDPQTGYIEDWLDGRHWHVLYTCPPQ